MSTIFNGKAFVSRGSGGVQANTAKEETNTTNEANLINQAGQQSQGLWDQFNTMNQQMQPTYQSLQGVVDNQGKGGAGSAFATLDPTTTANQVTQAYQRSSNQTLADQYKSLQNQLAQSNAQRGITNSSFNTNGMTSLAIGNAQAQATNSANALTQGIQTQEQLQAQQQQNYLQALGILQGQSNNLYNQGNPQQEISNLGAMNGQYSNIANQYSQIGQQEMQGLGSLAGLGGTIYGLVSKAGGGSGGSSGAQSADIANQYIPYQAPAGSGALTQAQLINAGYMPPNTGLIP